jgi:hypothetical protein
MLELPPTDALQARKRRPQNFTSKMENVREKWHTLPLLVVQNAKTKLAILTQAYENIGHKGEQVVYKLMEVRLFWLHMRTDVYHHIGHECQIHTLKRIEVPVTISALVTLFKKVYIDVIYLHNTGT